MGLFIFRDFILIYKYSMPYQIVTNLKIMNYIKKSRYYRVNLGLANTVNDPKGGDRIFNQRDKFQFFYNNQYKTTIYGQGNVADMMFYVDHYIKDDVMAVYLGEEEFIFELDEKLIKEKGPDYYLGHILKELDDQHEERVKKVEEKKAEPIIEANPDKVMINPGAVNYADLQAYLKKKREERYSVENFPKQE
jgi:hypothetical protein